MPSLPSEPTTTQGYEEGPDESVSRLLQEWATQFRAAGEITGGEREPVRAVIRDVLRWGRRISQIPLGRDSDNSCKFALQDFIEELTKRLARSVLSL